MADHLLQVLQNYNKYIDSDLLDSDKHDLTTPGACAKTLHTSDAQRLAWY